jgi:hypothetical protein
MLKDTILKFFKIDGFIEGLGGYIETRAELFKLEIKEEITKSLAKLSVFFLLTVFFIASLMFISVAFALWLGTLVGTMAGFAIVGGLYLIVTVTLLLFQKQIIQSIEKQLMKLVNPKK